MLTYDAMDLCFSSPVSPPRARDMRSHSSAPSMLVLYSAPRGFFPGSPNFPCPPKIDISKSQFDRMRENHFRVSGASWLNIINHKNPLLRNWLLKALNVFCVLQQEKHYLTCFGSFVFNSTDKFLDKILERVVGL